MKTLTLVCDCGAKESFRGSDLDGVLAAIDETEWQDQGYRDDVQLPHGQCAGECPECIKKRVMAE